MRRDAPSGPEGGRPPGVMGLVLAYMALTAGGLLFHLVQHPPWQSLFFWFAAPASALSLVLLPPLFLHPATVGLARFLNDTGVGLGCIAMTYLALKGSPWPPSPADVIQEPSIPAVLILLAKLPLARSIQVQVRAWGRTQEERRACRP